MTKISMLLCAAATLWVAACNAPESADALAAAISGADAPTAEGRLLPWGDGPTEVSLEPAAFERLAEGPSAVAVGPDGAVFLLDRLNGRVLRLTAGGAQVAADVPEEAMDLAVGPDNALAAYSPFMARVWIYQPDGRFMGEVGVPREIRLARGIRLINSRRAVLHTADQATHLLGSPSAPLRLPEVLHSRRSGEYQLDSGLGVTVELDAERRPVVSLREPRGSGRAERSFTLPEAVSAARIVGVSGSIACLRLERAEDGPPISVARSAVCIDLTSGDGILERALPPPGLYLPRRELALGGDPPALVFIHPEREGLRVHAWPVSEAAERRAR
jgi:hypothetical protein